MAEKAEEEGGELVFAGSLSFSMTGRSKEGLCYDGVPPKLIVSFSRLQPFLKVAITKIFCGPLAHHFVAVGASGTVWTWGRNEHGQLGQGDRVNRYNPTPLGIKHVVSAACSSTHTLMCTNKGKVWGCGGNRNVQLGIGNRLDDCVPSPKEVAFGGVATQVATGKDFSCLIASDGALYSFGSPENGCLGNGSEGKTLEKAGKFTYAIEKTPQPVQELAGIEITMVACGSMHTVCADKKGRVWSWGFNGYGNLGLGHNKTTMRPTPVAFFHNTKKKKPDNIPSFMWRAQPEMRAKSICCGMNCCYVIANRDVLYFWGIRKVSNEAKLKPEYCDGVEGWTCHNVAAGPTATILSAEYQDDHSLITWGGSPTHGELGYGPDAKFKSSPQPKKVDSLEGASVLQVAMGAGYALAIVKRNAKGEKLLKTCAILDPKEPGVVPPAGRSGPGKKKRASNGSSSKKKRRK